MDGSEQGVSGGGGGKEGGAGGAEAAQTKVVEEAGAQAVGMEEVVKMAAAAVEKLKQVGGGRLGGGGGGWQRGLMFIFMFGCLGDWVRWVQEKKQKRADSMSGKRKTARTAAEATATMLSRKVRRMMGLGIWGLDGVDFGV